MDFLTITANDFGDKGATAIADLLSNNSKIVELDINDNWSIGVEGLTAIAESLKINSTLEHLDIGGFCLVI